MSLCAMRWNENHISESYNSLYGQNGEDYRKEWHQHVHAKVFNLYPCHTYIEKRGKRRRQTPAENLLRNLLPQTQKKKRLNLR